jgi:dsRNA-specific ribonuclease
MADRCQLIAALAVSAAYESISAKLEELRKQQAQQSADSDQPSAKNSEAADSRKLTAESSEEDDDEAIAEIDIDSEEEVEVTVKSKKEAEQKAARDAFRKCANKFK